MRGGVEWLRGMSAIWPHPLADQLLTPLNCLLRICLENKKVTKTGDIVTALKSAKMAGLLALADEFAKFDFSGSRGADPQQTPSESDPTDNIQGECQ